MWGSIGGTGVGEGWQPSKWTDLGQSPTGGQPMRRVALWYVDLMDHNGKGSMYIY